MQKIIVSILLLLLSACAHFNQDAFATHPSQSVNHYLSWIKRKAQLNTLQAWKASGNISIHSKDNLGTNASFNWTQLKTNYRLSLFGPLGTQGILLLGDAKQVTLLTHNQTYTAQDADYLVRQKLGLHLPISQLYYWLRGLPAPQSRYTLNLDAYNHLLKLRQSNWRVHYNHYTNVENIDLPDRIELQNPYWQVRILITQWHID